MKLETKLRRLARKMVAVKITSKKRSVSGFVVLSPTGDILHACPSKKEALVHLLIRMRSAGRRTFQIAPAHSAKGRS